jgi:hypothetical protein
MLFWAPGLAAQAGEAAALRCGELCILSQTMKDLRVLPPLPAKDPMPGDEFEPPVKAYSDCTVEAFHKSGGDWGAVPERIDAALDDAFGQCIGKRIEAAALFAGYFDKRHPALSADQKRIYASYVIGMHGMMTLIKDAEASGKRDAGRSYMTSHIDKSDLSFGLLYFNVDD